MDLVGRLNLFIKDLGVSSSYFAEKIGIPKPSLSQILNGRNKKISNELIAKIHQSFPSLNVSWLLFGEGEMMINKTKTIDDNPYTNNETVATMETHEPGRYNIKNDRNIAFANQNTSDQMQNENNDLSLHLQSKTKGHSLSIEEQVVESDNLQLQKENISEDTIELSADTIPSDAAAAVNVSTIVSNCNDSTPNCTKPKKISSIFVFYDDDTYQVFRPGKL